MPSSVVSLSPLSTSSLAPRPSTATPGQQAYIGENPVVVHPRRGRATSNLNDLESFAEKKVEEMTRTLDRLKYVHVKSEADKLAKQLFQSARRALGFLEGLGQLHPFASGVVKAVSIVVNQECQRHENDAHIAIVHTSMLKTVFHLRFLNHGNSTSYDGELSLNEVMEVLCKNMVGTIHSFGAFVDMYHTHWQRTVKFIFSHEHKRKLEQFGEEFDQLRREMDDIYKSKMQIQLTTAVANTTEILNILRFSDPNTQLLAQLALRRDGNDGGPRTDKAVIEKVAAHMKEKVTHTMLNALDKDYNELVQRHTPRYRMKCQSIEASIESKRRVIRIQEGHFELIQDEELQRLWTDFAAIGDIIDEDGSGYISALELDTFLKSEQRCLPHWTKPQWFAFWASGWHNNNAWYHDKIEQMMQSLPHALQRTRRDPHDTQWEIVTKMLLPLKSLLLVMGNDESHGANESDVPHQLLDLQQEFREREERAISDRLREFGSHLGDRTSIVTVVGDSRIELHIMPLIYILATSLTQLTTKVVNQRQRNAEDMCEIEALVMSCITLFVAFDGRLRDLSRGWRLEAKDIGMQVDRYADGLFKKYYAKPWVFHKAYDDLRRCIVEDEHELPLHLRPVMRTQLSAPMDAVATLSRRVEALEARLHPFSTFARKFKGVFQRMKAKTAELRGEVGGDDQRASATGSLPY
ncbi:hypothetical protein GY45DRAFT_1371176 [Cubamyces sp. BRFM 1775]|nr:hypothetical protein GY45DRAFT_1371176 [Cubamyces sp. BRFM 1775]